MRVPDAFDIAFVVCSGNCHRLQTNHHYDRYCGLGGDIDARFLGAVATPLEPSEGNADHGVESYHEGCGENRVHLPAKAQRRPRESQRRCGQR
jgi:hypothetical protein